VHSRTGVGAASASARSASARPRRSSKSAVGAEAVSRCLRSRLPSTPLRPGKPAPTWIALIAATLALASQPWIARTAAVRQSPPSTPPDSRIEIVVVDRDGRPVDGLRPFDFTVTVDGVARQVVSVRRVSRGPGADSDAALRQSSATPGQSFAAEPIRNVLVIIDQALVVLGEEKLAVQASRAFLDRLGIGDRVAVVRLPFSADQRVELTTERPAAREALARVRGQASRASLSPSDATAIERPAVVDPDQAETQPARQEVASPGIAVGSPEAELTHARNSLAAITGLLRSLRPFPGRKVVAVFSPGFSGASTQAVDDASAAAIASGATVYGFGLPSLQDEPQSRPDTAALETLAKNTGGACVMLGSKPERLIERTMDDLLSVYVLGLAPAAGDVDGKRRLVKVQARRKDVVVRAPAWLAPAANPGDVEPAAARESAPPAPAAGGRAAAPPAAIPGARAVTPSGKDAELPVALARLFDYVRAYESQYSALVAEEDFRQVAGQKSVQMRSDFLLVQQESAGGWVSFRDVFEVNGAPVRDREDRLKKLFLDPGVDARRQAQSVIEDSARYNIGPLQRNINVPLFLLRFVSEANRSRSKFRIGARPEADGVQAWRIDFTEVDRPTIIADRNNEDVPAKGYFLVEQSTGAIMETQLRVDGTAYTAEIIVKFRLDPDLGLWVPARMNETYRTARTAGWAGGGTMSVALEGTAEYSKFRRFQVKTEETVTIKK
jgi:VWFA-related protein